MKILQEIESLLASENSTFEVNKYCTLHRFKKDCLGNAVDVLEAIFSISDDFSSIYELRNRKPQAIIRELARCQSFAFSLATGAFNDKLIKGLK